MTRFLCCLALLLSLSSCANLNKKPKFTISFHTEGGDMDSPRSVFPYVLPGEGRKVTMKWIPEFTEGNISAFQPFVADDGKSNGATFKLDFRGTNALTMVSRTQQGGIIMTVLNGKPIGYVTLDKPCGDGIIIVWEGISDEVIAEMKKKLPPIKGLQSVSAGHPDMMPTTTAEKKRAVDHAKAMDKAAAKDAADKLKHPEPAAPDASDLNKKIDPAEPQAPKMPEMPKRRTATPLIEQPISPVPAAR